MTQALPLPLSPSAVVRAHADTQANASRSLAAVEVGAVSRVTGLELEPEMCAWLRAVGIDEGARLTVLRRALFGGPIHVRASSGGEFALNRQLARAILVVAELA
jgi:ferrous iron transport protein A